MNDHDPSNLILEHLRVIRADVSGLRADLAEGKLRAGSVEDHLVGVRRDLALLHADIGITHHRLDLHEQRLGRIERRLQIRDA